MKPSDPVAVAAVVARAFELHGIRYILGGSLASTAHGQPRMTQDVDFAADLDPARVAPLLASLGSDFAADREWLQAEVRRRGSFQLVHLPTMIRVDVFLPAWRGLDLWKWEHRQRLALGDGVEIDVTSPEGIILQKLLWHRAGGGQSERQWHDVLGVLKTQGTSLDRSALRTWADQLQLREVLDRAAREAGLAP